VGVPKRAAPPLVTPGGHQCALSRDWPPELGGYFALSMDRQEKGMCASASLIFQAHLAPCRQACKRPTSHVQRHHATAVTSGAEASGANRQRVP